ncbi:MAG: hypothetical protein ACRDJ3_07415, partial [Solirubrobacteraceae bacterium]
FGSSAFVAGVRSATNPGSTIFQPWQLWWFFGHHGHVVRGLFGAIKPGYRTAPGWTATVGHPLIVGIALPLTLGIWARRRRAAIEAKAAVSSLADALLLLALLLLLRCMFDTWDVIYYPLPFILALGAWETIGKGRIPVLALTSTVAVWAESRWLPSFASADLQAAFFAAWTLPIAAGLAFELYAPGWLIGHTLKPRLLDRRQLLGKAREQLGTVIAYDG